MLDAAEIAINKPAIWIIFSQLYSWV